MTDEENSNVLADDLALLLAEAKRAGAYQAEAAGVCGQALHCRTRGGLREEVGWAEEQAFSLRVLAEVQDEANGGTSLAEAVATCSLPAKKEGAKAPSDKERLARLATLAERAGEMARLAPPNPWLGLATDDELHHAQADKATPPLELCEEARPPRASLLVEDCAALEAASLAVEGVRAVAEAEAHWGISDSLLCASNGVIRQQRHSFCARSIAAVAGAGADMQVDWESHSSPWRADLESCEALGEQAGKRVVAKHNPKLPSKGGLATAVFEPRVASVFLGALVGAANGESLVRGTSFLLGREQEILLPKNIKITDEPLRIRGHRSRLYDAEGLACKTLTLYENGKFAHPLLDLARARQMERTPSGNGRGAGGSKSCGASNFCLRGGTHAPLDLLKQASESGQIAVYVTDLLGSGLNPVSGDWSQGFQGFLIEGSARTTALSGATLAGNLRDFLPHLLAGNDLALRTGSDSPSLLIPNLTLGVAG